MPDVEEQWPGWPACPCDCGIEALKLQRPLPIKGFPSDGEQHVVGCMCRRHIGKRSRKKGREGQTQGLRAAGHTGKTSADEEAQAAVPIKVQIEFKKGYAAKTVRFYQFIASVFFERALSQADRAVRIGEGGVFPGVMLDGKWLIVDMRKKKKI